jgi:CRP-like cAMP-binding protein
MQTCRIDLPRRPAPAAAHPARKNQLLAALPERDWQRWLPALEPVELPLGKVLYEPGTILSHVVFPTSALVSLQYVTEGGAASGSAVVGAEGLVGIALFMGGETTASRAVVQCAGQGFRLSRCVLKAEFHQPAVQLLLLRYTQALMTQMAQTAVCNRHHTLDRQLCRSLLQSLDRLDGNELRMTHELIANMLGVRREGVSEAALKLQVAGLIRYARGHITVLDRGALEQRTCECYGVVRKEYERLLPRPAAALADAAPAGSPFHHRPFLHVGLSQTRQMRPANPRHDTGLAAAAGKRSATRRPDSTSPPA